MRWTGGAGLVLILVLAGCGGTTTGNNNNEDPNYPSDPGGTPSQSAVIELRDDEYVPNSVVVAVGGTVTFRWIGNNGHSVTPGDGTIFSPTSPIAYPPKEIVVTFTEAGSYHFYCLLHGIATQYGYGGDMTGTVTVR
jgi:plastocyanin